MTIYVITPARRGTAEAIHLMFTHALGEAGAPYLVSNYAPTENPGGLLSLAIQPVHMSTTV